METNLPPLDNRFQKASILLVEDNDDLWSITRIALRKELPGLQLTRVATDQQALAYMTNCVEQDLPLPQLVIQDLYLPELDNGLNLLLATRKQLANSAWPNLPIIMMSSSSNPADIQACYRNGATAYVIKPVRTDKRASVYQTIRKFWWETSVFPQVNVQS